MAVEDRIVIQIAAEYSDNTGGEFQKSAKSADKYCESVNKLKKQLDSVSKTKVRTNLEANDRATQVIDKVKDNINYLKNHKAQIPLLALDKASSVIENTKNKAISLAGKTFRITVGVLDKATAPLQKIWNYTKSLKGIMARIFAGAATQQFVMKPAQMAIDRQNVTTAFENLLGSKDAANQRVSDLTTFAGQTPFTRDDIFEASRVLQVFTGDALSTADGLKTVGDVASGTQQDFKEVAVWMGRLYSGMKSGQPIGEATARLQEMGAISGESRVKLEALAKSGRDISETWPEATAEFAQFDGMMLKMSDGFQNLLLGAKSFVNNNVWQRIGAGIINGFTPALQKFRDWRSENKELIDEMANNIESGVTNIVSKVSGGVEKIFDITSKLIKDDTFKNADFMGKADMLWDQLIAEPFSSWWNGGGKDKVKEGVKNAANGIKDILIDVLGEAFELAFSNPITGTIATLYGAKYGINIGKGILSGVKTAKGAVNELKNIYKTAGKVMGILKGTEIIPQMPYGVVGSSASSAANGISEVAKATSAGAEKTFLLSKATSGLSSIMAAIPAPVKVAVAAIGLAAAGFAIYTKKQEEHRTALVNAGDDYLEASAKFEEANKNYEEQTANLKNQADAVQRYRDLTNEINTGGLEDDVLNTKLQERDETLLSIKEHYPAAFGEGVSNEEGLQKVEELIKKEQDYQKVLKDRADIELANAQTELIMKLPDMESEKEKLQKELESITKDEQIAVDIEAKISTVTQTVNDLEMQISTGVDQEEIEKTKQILSDQLGDTLKSLQEAPGNVQLEFETALSGIRNDLDKGLEIPQEKIDKLHGAFSGIQSYVNDVKGKFDQTEMQISSIEKSISLGNTVLDEMRQKSGETKGVVDEAKDSASETNKNVQETEKSMGILSNNTTARKGPVLDAFSAWSKTLGESKEKTEDINTEIDKLPANKKVVVSVITKYSTIGVPTPQRSDATKSNASYFEKYFDEIHADGGFMTRPHVGLVAEDGAESIIPLSPKRRSRGIALWQETGRRLGVMAYAEGGIVGQAESYPMAAGGDTYTSSGSGGPSVSGGGGETGRMLSFETGGLKEDLAEADQFFQEYSSNLLTAGLSTWDNLKNNVTSKTQEMNDTDKAKFDEFAQYFTTFGTGVVLTGAAAFDALKGGVVTKSTDTVKFGVSKFNEFSNYVGTLPPVFGGYGADMMSELAYGIESQRAAVLKSTSTLVQDLLSTFITGLGIHSPSKKMQWVGEMMAAGIIKGLSADQITQYVYYIIDQMQSSFSSGKLDVGTVVDKLDDNIPALVAKLGVDPKEAASLIYPLLGTAGTLTSVFGGRDAPTAGASTNHGGIDLAAPTGTQIAAVLGGLVTIAGDYGGYGNAVKIDHGNGVESLYGHMSAVGVTPGQQVTAGQVIGNVGSTGISTGPHLHLSMYKGGEAIDPLPYVQGAPIMAGNTLAGALMAEYNRRKFGIGAAGALGGGGDVASWIMQALAITGQSMDYLDELMYIAQMESGGDPNAINLWDSNAAAGHPSKGLMQTIDSTFAAYALPGYDDIWNPVHNTIAAIRYMNERYGGIQNHPGLGGKGYIGYAVGTREVPQDMLAVIHKDEAIFPAAQNPFSKSGGDMIADMVSKVLPFPEMESNSIRNEKGDFAERNNVIEFPERKSDSGQPASVEAVPVVASQNAAPGGMTVSINLGGISISIDGSNAGTPQDIEALLRAQIPGIANDLCAQIAQKLTEILAGMPTRSEAV